MTTETDTNDEQHEEEQQTQIQEPSRTVSVDRAHLLRAQVEHSEQEADGGDELDRAYHEYRIDFTKQQIQQIESEGIEESELSSSIEKLREQVEATEPDTDERLEVEAEYDTLRQINERYFGGGPDVVEVEAMHLIGYNDGTVEFQDGSAKAVVTFPGEAEARGAADAILDGNGLKDEAARVGMR